MGDDVEMGQDCHLPGLTLLTVTQGLRYWAVRGGGEEGSQGCLACMYI